MNWTAKEQRGTGVFPTFGRVDTTKKDARTQANKSVLRSGKFIESCKRAEVEPTKRQASKWNSRKGAAYARRNF